MSLTKVKPRNQKPLALIEEKNKTNISTFSTSNTYNSLTAKPMTLNF
jgi:hypothetical protein